MLQDWLRWQVLMWHFLVFVLTGRLFRPLYSLTFKQRGMFTRQPGRLKTPVLWLQPLKKRIDALRRAKEPLVCVTVGVCVCVHAHGYLQVDSTACYVTEGELLWIWPSGWHPLTPSWWGSQINTLLTSNPHFAGRKVHTNTAWTHTHTHSRSKSSLTLPMVLHDRLQAALMNTHTKPNQTRIHALAHTHTHRMGLISPVQSVYCTFPKSFAPQGPQ